ncbi:MAG: hypothetical protein NTZ78_12505 [Candidatus Aureabacteria bacterium]|nr:hypothetical protein [Candidatus Auribacterota bacterium]
MKGRLDTHSFALTLLLALLALCGGSLAIAQLLAGSGGGGLLSLVLTEAGRMAGMLVFLLYPAFAWQERFAPRGNFGETLFAGFVWNVWGWILVTSLLKAVGVAMTPAWLWGIMCVGICPAFFWGRARNGAAVGGIPWLRYLVLCFIIQLAFPLLFPKYFSWGIDRYWVAAGNWINPIPISQELHSWEFSGNDSPISPIAVYAREGARPLGKGRWLLSGEEAIFRVKNERGTALDAHLRFFFSGHDPATVTVQIGDGAPEQGTLFSPTPDARPDFWVKNYNRYIWQRMCHIPPGETTVRMRISPSATPELPLVVENYSGLNRTAFFSRAEERWLFCEVGALYDILDIVDPPIYMRRLLFPYMSGLIDRRPGYTVTIPPMSVWVNMIASTPFSGDGYGAMRTAGLAKGFLLSLCMFLLYRYRNENAGIFPGAMLLFPIVASTINIVNFHLFVSAEDHFFTLILLLSIYWLECDRKPEAIAVAAMLMLTRLNGFQMLMFAYASWSIVSKEWRRPLGLLLILGVIYGIYWSAVFWFGSILGSLPLWKAHLYDETWRFRFSGLSFRSYVLNAGTLAEWAVITSCFLIFPAFLKPDRVSKTLIIFSVLYLPLVAATRLIKVYYLPPMVMPLAIAACRNISQFAARCSATGITVSADRRCYRCLLLLLLLLGTGCLIYLLREPLVYPAFSAYWPAWSSGHEWK